MSDNTDWTLIVRSSQKAAGAAEAALAIAQRQETEFGTRLSAIERRMESFVAGLNSLERGILRITDKQLDHDGRLDAIEATLADHTAQLGRIEATLAAILAKLP